MVLRSLTASGSGASGDASALGMLQQHQLPQTLNGSIAAVRGISTAGSFAPPSCVAPAQPFCIATGISAPTTSPGYVPLQGVASADSRPSLQPPSLEELPDPEAIE